MKIAFIAAKQAAAGKNGQPMVTVEDLELITAAEEDYRTWKLAVLFNKGPQATISRYGIRRDFYTKVRAPFMKKRHLAGFLILVRMQHCLRVNEAFSVPPELGYLIKWHLKEITPEVLVAWGFQAAERPLVQRHNGLYPKVKNLVWQVWQHLAGGLKVGGHRTSPETTPDSKGS